ncbi:MAG: DUF4214 domain-containing protein [Gammaproteobacteria bacterium]|nr:DUF4214 domain-containing protein [Gammaproteobacteria bacterium]
MSYKLVIDIAYMDILNRMADPGGLENYQDRMAAGMTEATLRESLIRSNEYKEKNRG